MPGFEVLGLRRSFFLSSCSIHFGSFKSGTHVAFGPLTFAETLGKNLSSHPVAQGVCDTKISVSFILIGFRTVKTPLPSFFRFFEERPRTHYNSLIPFSIFRVGHRSPAWSASDIGARHPSPVGPGCGVDWLLGAALGNSTQFCGQREKMSNFVRRISNSQSKSKHRRQRKTYMHYFYPCWSDWNDHHPPIHFDFWGVLVGSELTLSHLDYFCWLPCVPNYGPTMRLIFICFLLFSRIISLWLPKNVNHPQLHIKGSLSHHVIKSCETLTPLLAKDHWCDRLPARLRLPLSPNLGGAWVSSPPAGWGFKRCW